EGTWQHVLQPFGNSVGDLVSYLVTGAIDSIGDPVWIGVDDIAAAAGVGFAVRQHIKHTEKYGDHSIASRSFDKLVNVLEADSSAGAKELLDIMEHVIGACAVKYGFDNRQIRNEYRNANIWTMDVGQEINSINAAHAFDPPYDSLD